MALGCHSLESTDAVRLMIPMNNELIVCLCLARACALFLSRARALAMSVFLFPSTFPGLPCSIAFCLSCLALALARLLNARARSYQAPTFANKHSGPLGTARESRDAD